MTLFPNAKINHRTKLNLQSVQSISKPCSSAHGIRKRYVNRQSGTTTKQTTVWIEQLQRLMFQDVRLMTLCPNAKIKNAKKVKSNHGYAQIKNLLAKKENKKLSGINQKRVATFQEHRKHGNQNVMPKTLKRSAKNGIKLRVKNALKVKLSHGYAQKTSLLASKEHKKLNMIALKTAATFQDKKQDGDLNVIQNTFIKNALIGNL